MFDEMGSGTRSNVSEKRAIKECVMEILNDTNFMSQLVEKVADRFEALFDMKYKQLETRCQQLENVNKELRDEIVKIGGDNQKCLEAVDAVEQYSRRNSIRVLGVPCVSANETEKAVLELINNGSGLSILPDHVDRCHPVGRERNGRRDIIVKFTSYRFRREVLSKRKEFRESGISVVEDLTSKRYKLLKSARAHLGAREVWVSEGRVYCRVEGTKTHIRSDADLQSLPPGQPA